MPILGMSQDVDVSGVQHGADHRAERIETVKTLWEVVMPFVSIRILDEHTQRRKNQIAQRVTEAISDVTGLPEEAVWVVFEDISNTDWYVGAETVKAMRAGAKKQAAAKSRAGRRTSRARTTASSSRPRTTSKTARARRR